MIHFTAYMQWPATICTINFIIEKGIHLMGTFIILFVFIVWLVFSNKVGTLMMLPLVSKMKEVSNNTTSTIEYISSHPFPEIIPVQ